MTQKELDDIKNDAAAGLSPERIAEKLGTSRNTLIAHLTSHGLELKLNPPSWALVPIEARTDALAKQV